jgi:hypothetical protein
LAKDPLEAGVESYFAGLGKADEPFYMLDGQDACFENTTLPMNAIAEELSSSGTMSAIPLSGVRETRHDSWSARVRGVSDRKESDSLWPQG